MNKYVWIMGGLLAFLLVAYVAVAGFTTITERKETASRYLSADRPAGADVYVELDVQTLTHPWTYTPARIEVKVGQKVAIGLKNGDRLPHDVVFGAPYTVRTEVLQTGQTQWVLFTADRPTQSTPFWCSVPGHRQNGMHGVLVVKEG